LAKLAAALIFPNNESAHVRVEERWLLPAVLELVQEEHEVNVVVVANVEEDDWRKSFFDYFNHGIHPNDPVARRQLLRRAPSYLLKAGILFRRSFDGVLLRCVSRDEANSILKEVHSGVCGGHQSGAKMYHSIRLAGYYWPKIMTDCLDAAKACHMCQIRGDFKHRPPVPLHPTVPSWPFDAWGIDVICPFDPPSD